MCMDNINPVVSDHDTNKSLHHTIRIQQKHLIMGTFIASAAYILNITCISK
jgi:hypothetical protein